MGKIRWRAAVALQDATQQSRRLTAPLMAGNDNIANRTEIVGRDRCQSTLLQPVAHNLAGREIRLIHQAGQSEQIKLIERIG